MSAPESMLSLALRYAARGLPVFPCHPAAKKPLTEHGFKDATTDADCITRWWRAWPDAMIGMPTGRVSDVFVVDLDCKPGRPDGVANFAAMADGNSRRVTTLTVATPSGGRHLYFRMPPDGEIRSSTGRLAPGIDVRGDGGYIIAPGSRTADGRGYSIVPPARRPSRAPDWLLEMVTRQDLPEAAPELPEPTGGIVQDRDAEPWTEAALAGEIDRMRSAYPGIRNDTLNRCAFALGQIVGAGHLSRTRVERELTAAAVSTGLQRHEIAGTLLSGLSAGLKEPRGPSGPSASDRQRIGSHPAPARLPSGRPASADWPEPDRSLLEPERGSPPPFPGPQVFGEQWSHWIATAADAKGAPQDYVAVTLLVVAGSLIGNARWASPWEGWIEPPILWGMLIGPPSAGKSPAMDAVLTPLRGIEADLVREADAALADWQQRADVAELAQRNWKDGAAAAIKAGRPAPEKPADADPGPKPHSPRLVVNDATLEKLTVILSRQEKAPMMVRDELAGWLANMSRYANGGSDRPFWLEAFGGRPFTVERISREPVRIERLAVGVLGGIQPDRLSALLLKSDDDGLLARFLPVWPDLAPIRRPTAAPNEKLARTAFERLYQLAMPVGVDGEPKPWFVAFDPEAQAILDHFRERVRERERETSGLMCSFVGKTPGLVVRLTLILACLDWAIEAKVTPPKRVRSEQVERAVHFVETYAIPMARRAYADAATPPEERAARRLARVIATELPTILTVREIQRRKLEGLRTAPAIRQALDLLADASWVRQETEATKGRSRTLYRINPKLVAA